MSKLPEWPEVESFIREHGEDSRLWQSLVIKAALARMEALVEYAQHDDWCTKWSGDPEGGRWLMDHAHCTCGLSALLAACERKEAGR